MEITEVVNVQVSVEEAGIKGLAFGIPLVLGPTGFGVSSDRVRSYDDMEGVAEDFETTDPEYKAAAALFGQELKPDHILIGERSASAVAQVTTVAISTVTNSFEYGVLLNNTLFTYEADSDATQEEIRAGLIAAINGGSEPVTAANGVGDNVFTLTADVAGTPFTLQLLTDKLDQELTTANRAVEDPDDALNAILESGDLGKQWVVLMMTSHVKADILNAAAWVQTRNHLYVACGDDSDVPAATAGNVALELKTLAYTHTLYLHSGDEANYPEAALLGRVLPLEVGSWTPDMQTLTGITPDEWTSTQVSNLEAQYASFYVNIGNRGTLRGGWASNGNWWDAYLGALWIESECNAGIFNMMARLSPEKLPFTDGGIQLVVNEIRGVLLRAEAQGILAAEGETPAFSITAPPASSYSSAQKATRVMDGIEFTGNLAGAIRKVTVRGKLVN
jgi:hypothetical protein